MNQMRSELYMACKVAASLLDRKIDDQTLKKDLIALTARTEDKDYLFAGGLYRYIISVIENQEELERQRRLDK